MNAKYAMAALQLWKKPNVDRFAEEKPHWKTIGAERGADGKNHGGHPVKIRPDGTIEAGLGGKFNGQKIDQAFSNTSGDRRHHDALKPENATNDAPSAPTLKHPSEPSFITRDRQFDADLVKWRSMVASIGKSRGFKATDLDDFISETMLTAWKYRHLFDSNKGAFSTWLTKVATSTANNLHRRDTAKKRGAGKGIQSLSHGFDNKPIDVPARDEAENLTEQLAILRPMIIRLPEAQRRAVRGFMNGESVAEMATYFRMSKQAVSQSLSRGIEAIKRMTAGDDRFSVACQVERYATEAIRELPGLEEFHWRSVGRPNC